MAVSLTCLHPRPISLRLAVPGAVAVLVGIVAAVVTAGIDPRQMTLQIIVPILALLAGVASTWSP